MNKNQIMPTVVLSVICVTVALLLSVVNMVTAPVIEAAKDAAANEALLVVMPDGKDFEELDLSQYQVSPAVLNIYKETSGLGYVFRVTAVGYKPGLVVMCGVDSDGKITGTKFVESQETYGLEGKLDGAYNGQTYDSAELVIAAGASPNSATSKGYFDAVTAALQSYFVLSGGTVDFRDPAQILNDNCNAALGTEGKTFEKWFAVETLEGVDALYTAEGTEGAVLKIGDVFVGVGADGKAIPADGVDAEAIAKAEAAYATYQGSSLEQITLPEGVSSDVLGAWKTASGNYVLEMQASGYGIKGEYVASGEHIKLKIALTADGKIISTLTTYENETDGIGDVCADPEYYEQFNGKTAEDYTKVENVGGATVTTSAYKTAVKKAFETLELIKGGATE